MLESEKALMNSLWAAREAFIELKPKGERLENCQRFMPYNTEQRNLEYLAVGSEWATISNPQGKVVGFQVWGGPESSFVVCSDPDWGRWAKFPISYHHQMIYKTIVSGIQTAHLQPGWTATQIDYDQNRSKIVLDVLAQCFMKHAKLLIRKA